jgi:hypothetical protein
MRNPLLFVLLEGFFLSAVGTLLRLALALFLKPAIAAFE